MIQEQGSTVLANFADQNTQLSMSKLTNGLIDFQIPAAWAQSLNQYLLLCWLRYLLTYGQGWVNIIQAQCTNLHLVQSLPDYPI